MWQNTSSLGAELQFVTILILAELSSWLCFSTFFPSFFCVTSKSWVKSNLAMHWWVSFFGKKNWTPLNSTFFSWKNSIIEDCCTTFFWRKTTRKQGFSNQNGNWTRDQEKTIPWSTSLTQIVVAVLYKSRQIIEESSALMPNGFYCWATIE